MTSESNYRVNGLLDALFFASYKPLHIDQIKRVLQIKSRSEVRTILNKYIKRFNMFHNGVMIINRKNYYFLSIKPDYVNKVRRYFREPPLTQRQKEILAIIYKHKRLAASELRDYFGPRVYSDLKKLLRLGLVKRERVGNRLFVVLRDEAHLLIFKK